MKINLLFLSFLLTTSLLCGCGTVKGIFGKASIKENRAKSKIELVNDYISKSNLDRLSEIGQYSYGISITSNVPPPAISLNERISSLANPITQEEKKSMKEIVSELETNNTTLLLQKDKEIVALQSKSVELMKDKEIAINNYIKLADKTAMEEDTIQARLNEYTGWFGIKAILMGGWQLIKTSFWFLAIGSIIFIVLRFASLSSPLAATIFSVIEHLFSYIITTVVSLAPKAITFAGYVKKEIMIEITKVENAISGSNK